MHRDRILAAVGCLFWVCATTGRAAPPETAPAPAVLNGGFEAWTNLVSAPVGWSLAGGWFPRDWLVEGRPGETGLVRKVVNAPLDRELHGQTALLLHGRILTVPAVAAGADLAGKSVELVVWARGDGGRLTVRLRLYQDASQIPGDRVARLATVIDTATTADWRPYRALVTVSRGERVARLDLEGTGVVLDGAELRLTEGPRREPCRSLWTLPAVPQPIVVDGQWTPEEWGRGVRIDGGFMNIQTHALLARQTDVDLASDGQTLFIGWRMVQRPGGFRCEVRERDGPVWEDESYEIFINPDYAGGRADAVRHLILNRAGTVYDAIDRASIGQTDSSWTCDGLTARAGWNHEEKVAVLEVALPLASAGIVPGRPFGLNLGRNLRGPDEHATLTGDGFKDYRAMIRCELSGAAPAVHWETTGPSDRQTAPGQVLNLANPTSGKQIWSVALADGSTERRQPVRLGTGETERVVLPADAAASRLADWSATVRRQDGSTSFYHRVRYDADSLIAAGAQRSLPTVADAAIECYPVQGKLNARFRNLESRQKRAGRPYAACLIQCFRRSGEAESGDPLWERRPVFEATVKRPLVVEDEAHYTTRLDASVRGICLVRALVHDEAGECLETLVEMIDRPELPWLGNPLGHDREVLPPFTPLCVHKKGSTATLASHGRNYVLDGSGFPLQIEAAGADLLSAPVHLLLETVDGAGQAEPRQRRLTFTEQADDAVAFRGRCGMEGLAVDVEGRMEFDGVIRYTLNVAPREPITVRRLALVIPLREVTYLHGVGIRRTPSHYLMESPGRAFAEPQVPEWGGEAWKSGPKDGGLAGRCAYFPPGEGVVWTSEEAERPAAKGNFLPSLWVGTARNGLTWFADSERGWRRTDGTPALVLYRRKTGFELHVNVMAGDVPLNQPRSVVFGLAATPVRPRLTGSNVTLNDQLGDPGGFGNPWPAQQEQGIVCQDLWLARKWFDRIRASRRVSNVYVANNLRSWGDPDVRRMRYEWGNLPFNFYTLTQFAMPYKWRGPDLANYVSIDTVLEPSCVDYTVYRMHEWLAEGGAGGVYMDNSYPQASRNVQHANGAFLDEEGRLRPSCYVFETRDLIRRCAMLGFRLGNPAPWFGVHMSHGNLPGIFGCADLLIDGEAAVPDSVDYMDFWPRVRLEVMAAGAAGGTLGWLPMLGYGERGRATKPTRTALALLKLYDLWIWHTSLNTDICKALTAIEKTFGVGEPDCRFLGYWEPAAQRMLRLPDPVKASYYCRNGTGVLAYLSNFSQAAQKIALRPEDRGKELAAWRVVDAENTQELRDPEIQVEAHDFRLLRFEPRRP